MRYALLVAVSLASLFLWSACALSTPIGTPDASPSASPSAAPSSTPPAEIIANETPGAMFPNNPVLLFYLGYDADTDIARASFCDALSANGGIDALNALMKLCEAESYLSKGRLNIGGMLFDGSSYSGAVNTGEGSVGASSGSLTFGFSGGGALYGALGQNRLGYFALDGTGAFLYMVRMEKSEEGWLVCADTASERFLMQWGEARRFTSFSGNFMPYLPEPAPATTAPRWDVAPTPTVLPSFLEEYWYDFTWDALAQGASAVFDASGDTLAILPGETQ
ncbi:MAG: hypothetical protein ABFC62_10225 [Clostridiaceae bacterium]|nr:hypothetical protein [Eubacteriales bacterium]